jgi:transposase
LLSCFRIQRIRYVEYVASLDGIVFLNSLHRAFQYIGGVPKNILFDNAKTVVSERVGSAIGFQVDLLQYAATVGFEPKACWVEDPETKGKVESTVGYVRRDFFYGQTFSSMDDLNRKAREWCDEVNRDVHSTTQQIPYEVWLNEKEVLRPLPTQEPTIFRIVKA